VPAVNPRHVPALLLAAAVMTGLTACSAPAGSVEAPKTPEAVAIAPAPEPTVPASTHPPVEEGAVIVVRAIATDTAGASMSLQLQVQQPQPADDVATQTLPEAVVQDCGAELTQALVEEQSWTFTRANLSAVPQGQWSGAHVALLPKASDPIAARGILTQDDAASVPCHQDKHFAGPGTGAIAIGIAGDGVTRTGWAGLRYGFSVADGVTLTECTVEVTDLGRAVRADWPVSADATACVAG
jgi:hypothetical protein